MKLANAKLSEFHFQFSIRLVDIENWREVAHDAQSAQIAQKQHERNITEIYLFD